MKKVLLSLAFVAVLATVSCKKAEEAIRKILCFLRLSTVVLAFSSRYRPVPIPSPSLWDAVTST